MDILINHCFCTDSIWGGWYDCRVIVSLRRITEGKTYYDKPDPDWALVTEQKFDGAEDSFRKKTLHVRPDVMEWLEKNVKDRKLVKWQKEEKEGYSPKGWAVGSDKYNTHDALGFSFFFERETDGMAFIKRWSIYKKPTYYCQYFKGIRKKLDLKTGKLKNEK